MIGAQWDISDPLKPFALFDTNADIKIPIGLNDWLTEIGAVYSSHDVLAPDPLECMEKGAYTADAAGTILVRMRVKPGAKFTAGARYPFTIRVMGADGSTQDDRTLFLKVVSR